MSACELFHDVSGKHSATLKLCSVPHQLQQRVFSFSAYEGDVAGVNDELASTKIGGECVPGLLELLPPDYLWGIWHEGKMLQPRLSQGPCRRPLDNPSVREHNRSENSPSTASYMGCQPSTTPVI